MKIMKMFFNQRLTCNLFQSLALLGICFLFPLTIQAAKGGKKISPDLFGLFFEDINYSADGGLTQS